jgi:hypothetical protein
MALCEAARSNDVRVAEDAREEALRD